MLKSKIHSNLGLSRYRRHKFDISNASYQTAVKMLKGLDTEESRKQMANILAEALIAQSHDTKDVSAEDVEAAVKLSKKHNVPIKHGKFCELMGTVSFMHGRMEECIKFNQMAVTKVDGIVDEFRNRPKKVHKPTQAELEGEEPEIRKPTPPPLSVRIATQVSTRAWKMMGEVNVALQNMKTVTTPTRSVSKLWRITRRRPSL